MLLIADPRPLVERLGPEFFRRAPEGPGVYLMRDADDAVLYVGKAKNLRKRLGSYRVANPQRLKRRQLRLLRAVDRIELEECASEAAAVAKESELLRNLRPPFNRAGIWPGPPRFLAWRLTPAGLELVVVPAGEPGWNWHGPLGAGAIALHAALVRQLWCVLRAERGLTGMPEGWFHGRFAGTALIRCGENDQRFEHAAERLGELFSSGSGDFIEWIRECGSTQCHPFELAVREADLETVSRFFS